MLLDLIVRVQSLIQINYGAAGKNDFSQLGDGTTFDRSYPNLIDVSFSDDEYAVEMGFGLYHSCIASNKHRVYCWGYNFDGQIGATNM